VWELWAAPPASISFREFDFMLKIEASLWMGARKMEK